MHYLPSRSLLSKAFFFLGIYLLFLATPGYPESASSMFSHGKSAEARGDDEAAFNYYEAAFKKSPNEIKYKAAYERSRFAAANSHIRKGEKLRAENKLMAALVEFLRALAIDPGSELAEQDIRQTRKEIDRLDNKEKKKIVPLPKSSPPAELVITHLEPITLRMTEATNVIYQTIGQTAGINVIMDPDYNSRRITVDLKDVTVLDALRIVGDMSNTFWKPVTHNTIFIAQNTRAKQQEINDQAMQVFYLSNISQQTDITDIQTALRSLLANSRMYALPSQNAIVVHGTPDELFIAKRMIQALDRPRPEVLVDVYVMEVSRDKLRNIGISAPTSISVSPASSTTLNAIARTSSYSFSMGTASAELLLTDSDTKILQNPRIRALDGQKATLKIGQKIPYATGSYTSTVTTSSVQTQFQYIDVGVNIDLTPNIHSDRDVTLKLAVEVSSQSGSVTISDVDEPVISQEKSEQVIRLKDGEVSILAGLISKTDTLSASGTPGLGEIPLLKYLFSTQKHEIKDDEIVFMLVPHVVRAAEVDDDNTQEISMGSGNSIRITRANVLSPEVNEKEPASDGSDKKQ